jgi:hypothetical protein
VSRMVPVIPLARCEICQGKGVIKGIFHVMDCAACNGAGLVDRKTHEALSLEVMVQQLRVRLNQANRQVEQQREQLERAGLVAVTGPAADYRGNNKKGAGGAHFTGD